MAMSNWLLVLLISKSGNVDDDDCDAACDENGGDEDVCVPLELSAVVSVVTRLPNDLISAAKNNSPRNLTTLSVPTTPARQPQR